MKHLYLVALLSAVLASSVTSLCWWLLSPPITRAAQPEDNLVVRSLQIVDGDGNVRISLAMGDAGPRVRVSSQDGTVSATLYTVDGPGGGAVIRLEGGDGTASELVNNELLVPSINGQPSAASAPPAQTNAVGYQQVQGQMADMERRLNNRISCVYSAALQVARDAARNSPYGLSLPTVCP